MTTLLIMWALGPRICKRFMIPALIASVAIDADHIPGQLGVNWLTAGTPRPYTHSLLTIVVVLGIAALWRARRDVVLGVAIGLALHFFRDLAEGDAGVSLLWPVSYHSFQYPHGVYVAIMVAVVMIDAARCVVGSGAPAHTAQLRAVATGARAFVRTSEKLPEPYRRAAIVPM